MRQKLITTILLTLTIFFLFAAPVAAEDIDDSLLPGIPGRIQGTGTFFEIKDSKYLNISLQSDKEITVVLESVPKTISLIIEASSVSDSAILTFSNLEPNKTYYKYDNSYKNETILISTSSGTYTFTQDLTRPHHVWFQETRGTIFIPDNCSDYGIWDEPTSTCTLSNDLVESMEITVDNVTLDCNNHKITGANTGYGIYVNSKSGIGIKNCSISGFSYGAYLGSSINNNISNNDISNNEWGGIFLYNSSNSIITENHVSKNGYNGIVLTCAWCQISNNTITENSILNNFDSGIYLYSATNNNVVGNNVVGNGGWGGIDLNNSSDNNITGNSLLNNVGAGIVLEGWQDRQSKGNKIIGNNASGNEHGIFLVYAAPENYFRNNSLANNKYNLSIYGYYMYYDSYQASHFIQDIDTSNTVDGKPIYYLVNEQDRIIDADSNAGFVGAINSKNITVKNIILENNYEGVLFFNTTDSEIENVSASNNKIGIGLHSSSNNSIHSSTTLNNENGIYLQLHSSNNSITENIISSNEYNGIYLYRSSDNIIIGNDISGQKNIGIFLTGAWYEGSNNNKIYHNNFIDNLYQVAVGGTGNIFDNGYPLDFDLSIHGGNYWSDYTGIDQFGGPSQNQSGSDGIGDTPYSISTIPIDNYPFMKKSGWEVSANQLPTFSSLNQYKSIAIESASISEGGITSDSTVVFKAMVSDPDNDKVKLEVELRQFTEPFTGQYDGGILISDFVNSGSQAIITRTDLVNDQYKWRARAIDEKGATSGDWQEFGTEGNVDFEVKFVPLYTQVFSKHPSEIETFQWSRQNYDYARADKPYGCGYTIGNCGCAITSMVMLGRYYNIDTAINDSNVDPGNINAWLIDNKGYINNKKSEKDGSLFWGKAIEYLGFINEQTGKHMARLNLDFYNASTSFPNQKDEIDEYINSSKPVIAHSDRFGHYFIIDNQIKDGAVTTYTLKDPKWFGTTKLNQIKNLGNPENPVQGYNNHFEEANLFSYLAEPKPITGLLYIYLASPAELLITDPLGRKLGKNPVAGLVYNEIPNGSYTKEGVIVSSDNPLNPDDFPEGKVIYISSLIDGEYDIKVIGTDSGTYALDFLAYDKTTQSTVESFYNVTDTGIISDYKVVYPSVPEEPIVIERVVVSSDLSREIDIARQLNLIDNDGIKKSLFQKLNNAQKQIEKNKYKTAINHLNAFINEVKAQKGKHIDSDFAEALIEDVQYLIKDLESSVSNNNKNTTAIPFIISGAVLAICGVVVVRKKRLRFRKKR